MEEERKILFFLEQIPQPGFLIRDGKKIKEEEELHDGETIKVNGKTSGG